MKLPLVGVALIGWSSMASAQELESLQHSLAQAQDVDQSTEAGEPPSATAPELPPKPASPPGLTDPAPQPGVSLTSGSERLIFVHIEATPSDVRLVDALTKKFICAGVCDTWVRARPGQAFALQASQSVGTDFGTFTLSGFTEAVAVSYAGRSDALRRAGIGALVAGGALAGVTLVGVVIASFSSLAGSSFSGRPGGSRSGAPSGWTPVLIAAAAISVSLFVLGPIALQLAGRSSLELRQPGEGELTRLRARHPRPADLPAASSGPDVDSTPDLSAGRCSAAEVTVMEAGGMSAAEIRDVCLKP